MDSEDTISSSEEMSSDESDCLDCGSWGLELTAEEERILKEKMASAQKHFKTYNSNQKAQKIEDVRNRIKDIDDKAVSIAIQSCSGNELLAIKRLTDDPEYKETVMRMASGEEEVDLDSIMYRDWKQEMREALAFDPELDSDDEEVDVYEVRRKRKHKKTDSGSGKSSSEDEFHCKEKGERKGPRLLLDDALIMLANVGKEEEDSSTSSEEKAIKKEGKADKTPSSSQKTSMIKGEKDLLAALSGSQAKKIPEDSLRKLGWSEARIKAFKNREKNPNQYYYRFNDPGEPQATGKWSEKDKALFLRLIKEKPVDYQWGIFSMKIPGRVGYQCSNFYRQLIKEGEIHDDNYVKDKDGKYVFQFRNKEGKSVLKRAKSETSTSKAKPRAKRQKSIYVDIPEELPEENVLPDYIDPMTCMPVEKPAISPYGHVMGYDSWVKILNKNPKNTCPFTKKTLTRRSLVKLTSRNFEEYKDKIIQVNGFDKNDS